MAPRSESRKCAGRLEELGAGAKAKISFSAKSGKPVAEAGLSRRIAGVAGKVRKVGVLPVPSF